MNIMIKQLQQKAIIDNIPIMQEEGLMFMCEKLNEHQASSVLEIGSAIGYSAIKMALVGKDIHIKTIERDFERYELAVENIKKFNLEDRITLIYNDAIDVEFNEKFDLVFIDAAKGKNMTFFKKFSKNLNNNGYIITDNINFHGYVNMDEDKIKSRNLRGLVRKIKEYINFLKENDEFETQFYDTGDGIAVSRKNNIN